jgi:ABC-type phosphate transport system auxiliary subunit
MERVMKQMGQDLKHERFVAANEELRGFLHRVDGLVRGTDSVSEGDLRSVSQRIANLAPEVGDASRGANLDAQLQQEIAEYVRNLRALQTALEKVRCVMLARKLQIESAKRHVEGVKGWVEAYTHTLHR